MTQSIHSARINNKRDLRLFLWYLSDKDKAIIFNILSDLKGVYDVNDVFGQDFELAENAINQALITIKDKSVKAIYTVLFDIFKNLKVPESEFSWIKKCPDACYFAWVYIKTIPHEQNSLLLPDINIVSKLRPGTYLEDHDFIYSKLQLTQYPVNNKERTQAVIDFFDRVPTNLRAKLDFMKLIRLEWERRYTLNVNFPLSTKEKKKCEWAWNYIQKDRSRLNTKQKRTLDGTPSAIYNSPPTHHGELLSIFRPSGSYEKYMAIKFMYIFNYVADDFFIKRFKKAWEVHKSRKLISINKKKITPKILSSTDLHDITDVLDHINESASTDSTVRENEIVIRSKVSKRKRKKKKGK